MLKLLAVFLSESVKDLTCGDRAAATKDLLLDPVHKLHQFITFAIEVMLSLVFVWLVGSVTQKPRKRFPWNLVERSCMTQVTTHTIYWIQVNGQLAQRTKFNTTLPQAVNNTQAKCEDDTRNCSPDKRPTDWHSPDVLLLTVALVTHHMYHPCYRSAVGIDPCVLCVCVCYRWKQVNHGGSVQTGCMFLHMSPCGLMHGCCCCCCWTLLIPCDRTSRGVHIVLQVVVEGCQCKSC